MSIDGQLMEIKEKARKKQKENDFSSLMMV